MKLMEIKFVEEERNFFQLGRDSRNPYMYALTIEAFKYNGELIDTGIEEIDRLADVRAVGIDYTVAAGGSGTYTVQEIVYQGNSLETATAKGYVSYWDKPSRVLRIRNIKGEFADSLAIIGHTSGASWSVSSGNEMENAVSFFDDNVRLEQEATNILDFSENNPFGEP